ELHVVRFVDLAHGVPVAPDEAVHLVRLVEEGVPLVLVEPEGVALAFVPVARAPAAHVPRVVVEPEAPETAELAFALLRQLGQEPRGPGDLAGAGTGPDEGELQAEAGDPGREAAVFGRVLLG